MAQRGRKSKAELAVVKPKGVTEIVQRPDPRIHLTDEQKQVWLTIVNRMPADWFPEETLDMLEHYCRHVISARRVAQLIARVESVAEIPDSADYDKLLKMQEREGRAITSLATKMRISQQSTQDQWRKKSSSPRKPSWVS